MFSPGLAPESAAWVAACPFAVVLCDPAPATLTVIAVNAAALALLGPFREPVAGTPVDVAGTLAAVAAELDDSREPALRERVAQTGCEGTGSRLTVLTRQRPAGAGVLLDVRVAPVGTAVALFLTEARAQDATETAVGAETAQRAIFEISRATHEAATLEALFARIHGIVERLIGAKNFYIALVDEREQLVRFVYSRDEFDEHRPDRRLGLGVTDIVYLTGRPLLLDRSTANRMLAEGQVINHGVPAQVWLGVPLIVAGKTVGVMAVQDYRNPHFLGEPERRLLSYISDQIANAIAIKRAQAEVERARAEAARAGQAKADFVAAMSHELRTPLAVVIGFGELLQESLAGRVEAKQAASITQAGQRLLEAVNQMLDFSKADGPAEPLHEEDVGCEELLDVCVAFFAERARAQGVSLAIRRDGHVPATLRTDRRILRQILTALLSNAVKYTPAGGRVVLAVRSEPVAPLHEERHQVIFAVEDNGAGISPEKQARLFQPFEQAQRPSPGEGAGLGLAISQRLAALLGGRITVRSTPGEGSVFALSLVTEPGAGVRAVPAGMDAAERLAVWLRSRLETLGRPWPILVIDPEEESRAVMIGMIARVTGVAPLAVADDAAARAWLAQARPAVILVNAGAPQLDGPAVCRALRAAMAGEGGARGFLVAFSVDHAPTHVQACLAAGADDYLPKPVSRLSLVQTLGAALKTGT